MQVEGFEFRVRGLVQGVGFRPWVWRLATEAGLHGDVRNDGAGVLIRAWGSTQQLASFSAMLDCDRPPLARVEAIERRPLAGLPPEAFTITASMPGEIDTGVVPDAATCPACLTEVLDPNNRRYRYPFTNCTHCGPRLSIVRAIPYDRANTAMAAFAMCGQCRAEYDDPADRRFHAEPNACPRCGPRVWLTDASGRELPATPGRDCIDEAAAHIKAGQIVAIKGLGGFHLACDATNREAVIRLRQRKRRSDKPFALMARDIAMVAKHACLEPAECELLAAASAPIVVLGRRPGSDSIAPEVSPGQSSVGFLLPYTPLHHLLARALDTPIVLTSGNISDEPQVTGNAEALAQLAGIADRWLLHDRDIVNRLDDSVARVSLSTPAVIRRARGMAPAPLALPAGFAGAPKVLALGAELKSTFCLLARGRLIVSQHIGDLEEPATHDDFSRSIALYRQLFGFAPDLVAVDAHPDYHSTELGRRLAATCGVPLWPVLHHHAHVAAVLAEYGRAADAPAVLAITLDGLGMGADGELWGGEIAKADYRRFDRLCRLAPVPLLGGAKAMREPWRNAFAHLATSLGWREVDSRFADLDIVRLLRTKQPSVLARMIERGVNAPSASSAGRLFDAAAAVLGVHPERVSYEGQAAIELEALAASVPDEPADGYAGEIVAGPVDMIAWGPLWLTLLTDLSAGGDRARLAARFHAGVARTIVTAATSAARRTGLQSVVVTGGVCQNRLLMRALTAGLQTHGLQVLAPRLFPANDGAIALGQATIAAAQGSASPIR